MVSNEADDHAEKVARYLDDHGFELEAAVNISAGLRVPDPRPDKRYGLVDIKARDDGLLIYVEIELPMGEWEGKNAFDLRRRLRPHIVRFQDDDRADQLWILTHKDYASRLSAALNQIFKWKPDSVEDYLSLDESYLRANERSWRLFFGWYRFCGAGCVRDIELRVPLGVGRLRLRTGVPVSLNKRLFGDVCSSFRP